MGWVDKWELGLSVVIGLIKCASPTDFLSSSVFFFFFFKHSPHKFQETLWKQAPLLNISADQTCNLLQQRLTLNHRPAGTIRLPWDKSDTVSCGWDLEETRLSLRPGRGGWKLGENLHLHAIICSNTDSCVICHRFLSTGLECIIICST